MGPEFTAKPEVIDRTIDHSTDLILVGNTSYRLKEDKIFVNSIYRFVETANG